MEQPFILIVAGVTSMGAYLLGVKWFRLSTHGLSQAIAKACEYLGLIVVFCLLNLAVGTLAVLGVRWLSGWFISIYIASDTTLVMLSLLQALIFQAWRDPSRHRHSSELGGSDLLHREP